MIMQITTTMDMMPHTVMTKRSYDDDGDDADNNSFFCFFIFILGDNKVILNIESQLNNDRLDAAHDNDEEEQRQRRQQ